MHLKRLEAFGFKSFADKVVFDFEPGFTGLVGPNGCGKSNIVDALKWVLGEQSAKSLRGGAMLDVIFNGSAHRKPLNFCEVRLTFDNASHTLPLDAPEITVSRRLYRSGESEYLINKALCRLRDVRELFWDTGIGTRSYSLIEQGRVSLLLEATNKERRFLFEEAAGIHKYKERKKIALRKLERVEANLARLNDLLGEVERNLRSVTRQASKARKAKEIGDRLRQIKREILLHDIFGFQAALREVEGALGGAQDRSAKLAAELGQAQAATLTEEEAMGRLDGEHSKMQQRLADARARLAALEEALKSERRAAGEMETEAERARALAQEAGARAAAFAAEREKTELDIVNARRALENRQESVKVLSESLAQDQGLHMETVQALEKARREALDLLGRRTQTQQALSQAEAEISNIDYRIRKAHAERTKAEDLLRFSQQEAGEVRGRMEQVRRRNETLLSERAGIRTLQARREDEIGRLTEESQRFRNALEKCRSRKVILEDLNESGEGLSPGVRAALTTLRNGGAEHGAWHGLVADCLGVYPQHETAIEVALGTYIEALVVDSAASAERLLERLRGEGLGRATFLALDRVAAALANRARPSGDSAEAAKAKGCLGRALDLITCEASRRPVAEALLGDVLIFDTLANAAAAHAPGEGGAWRRVTLAGDVLEPYGALSGGKYRFDRLGLIGRRNEIARLDVEMDRLRMKDEALAERIAFLEKHAQKLARDDERISENLSALAATLTELKGTLSAIAREESRSTEERSLAVDEIRELGSERARHAEGIAGLREEMEALKQQESAANEQVAVRSRELGEREETVARRRTSLEEMKRDASTLAVRLEGLQRHEQSLSAQFSERRDESNRQQCRAESLESRRAATEAAIAEKDEARLQLDAQIESQGAEVRRLAEAKEHSRLHFEDARGRERAVSTQLEEVRARASEIEGQQIERRLRLDAKLDQARQEFELDALQELAARGGPPEVSEEMIEEARQLEARLQRLGVVNMYALEEQKQLAERLANLRTQAGDLNSARSSVRDVIARINRRSRKQFQETFEAVRRHFQEIFRKLFGGGKADLMLEPGEDILEAGIEIVARPPGKEPCSIMQLSGGEKAMAAIALLFAVFRSRPAPFCVLDEVDAALDESNVDRFNTMLREFMDRSQFLVITHSKRTMRFAETLYGITMPEPGVSKRIAIRFEEIERRLPMEQIERQAEEARRAAVSTASEAKTLDSASSGKAPRARENVETETAAALGGGGGE